VTWFETATATLENDHVLLRPIDPDDRAGLHAQAMDPAIWRYFVTLVETDEDFDAFFDLALADQEAGRRITFCIVEKGSGRIAGSMSIFNMSEHDGRLEIGWSWLGREFQGHGVNRWAKYLMMEHAFEKMGAERVEFKTDALNVQARHGLQNIGATEEGTLRSFNPMPGGRRRDAVFFSVLKDEWPKVKEILASRPKVTAAAGAS
jgi:RimJ/RimL family protein N-acetyltransferase